MTTKPSARSGDSRPDRAGARLVQHIVAGWRCQALHAAIRLGLPEALADGAQPAAALADRLQCHAEAMLRLLRALCALGVCREQADARFVLTPAGQRLCAEPRNGAASLRDLALWWGGPLWPMWGELAYSVRTGASAREKLTGDARYAYLDKSTEMAAVFHGAQRAMTSLVQDDIARWPGWRRARQLLDLGGGHGQLALTLLRAHPRLQATVFDLGNAAAGAGAQIDSAGLGPRCRFVAGNFFESVPSGADVMLMKSILHNWDDERAAAILARCTAAAAPGTTLLIVERVRPPRLRVSAHDEAVARMDLNMLAGLGGRERSLEEFGAMLMQAGCTLVGMTPLAFEFSLVEARVGGT